MLQTMIMIVFGFSPIAQVMSGQASFSWTCFYVLVMIFLDGCSLQHNSSPCVHGA
jgi:hypothetical protein